MERTHFLPISWKLSCLLHCRIIKIGFLPIRLTRLNCRRHRGRTTSPRYVLLSFLSTTYPVGTNWGVTTQVAIGTVTVLRTQTDHPREVSDSIKDFFRYG
jgi:hypothetical protein